MGYAIQPGKVLAAGVRVVEIRGHGADPHPDSSDVLLVVDMYVVWRTPNDMSTPVPAPERSLRLIAAREMLPPGLHVGQDITVSARWTGSEWRVERIARLRARRTDTDRPTGVRRTDSV